MSKPSKPQQVHVRRRVQRPQHPVDVQRVGVGAASRTAARPTTWNTSPARTASSAASTAGWYCPAGVRDRARPAAPAGSRRRSAAPAWQVAWSSRPAGPPRRRTRRRRASAGASGGTSALAIEQHAGLVVVDDREVGGESMVSSGSPQVVGRVRPAAARSGGPRRSRGSRPARRSAAAGRAARRPAPGRAAPARSRASTSSGSPSVGAPGGGVPVQTARPSRSDSVAEHRDARRTTSATRTGRARPTRAGTCRAGPPASLR